MKKLLQDYSLNHENFRVFYKLFLVSNSKFKMNFIRKNKMDLDKIWNFKNLSIWIKKNLLK
jgi:hypothetical protein